MKRNANKQINCKNHVQYSTELRCRLSTSRNTPLCNNGRVTNSRKISFAILHGATVEAMQALAILHGATVEAMQVCAILHGATVEIFALCNLTLGGVSYTRRCSVHSAVYCTLGGVLVHSAVYVPKSAFFSKPLSLPL